MKIMIHVHDFSGLGFFLSVSIWLSPKALDSAYIQGGNKLGM